MVYGLKINPTHRPPTGEGDHTTVLDRSVVGFFICQKD
jgi:hypothetical protein